jgi:hypothetical protein
MNKVASLFRRLNFAGPPKKQLQPDVRFSDQSPYLGPPSK